MPVTVVAPGDRTSSGDLRALVQSYVSQYPAGAGDLLRLTTGESDPHPLFGAVSTLLGELGWDVDAAPDIEILPGRPLDVARPGQFVFTTASDDVRAVAAAGSLPLQSAWLPGPAASHLEALRRMVGYAGVTWIAETRRASGYASEARMFVQALDEGGVEPALVWPEPTRGRDRAVVHDRAADAPVRAAPSGAGGHAGRLAPPAGAGSELRRLRGHGVPDDVGDRHAAGGLAGAAERL